LLIGSGFRPENFTAHGGFAPYGIGGILGAVSSGGIVFCFVGFRAVIDLAGEARNPARSVPLSLVGSVVICLVIYVLLQIAFIGTVPPEHLQNGWSGIVENFAAGPFAGLAVIVGLQWLAMLVFADAVISPGGTALAYVGTSGRINYAMGLAGLFPGFFVRLNRFRVPARAMIVNSLIGVLILAPLPGWPQLAGFISSSAVLSLAIGPVALVVLRRQAPDYERPFKVPFAHAFSATAFVFVGFIVYWSGWDTNWKILLIAAAGTAAFIVWHVRRDGVRSLHIGSVAWLFLYFAFLAAVSWLGNFGNGLGLIPSGYDAAIIVVLSLVLFRLAQSTAFPVEEARRLIAETDARRRIGAESV
jgi:amino acid transporter